MSHEGLHSPLSSLWSFSAKATKQRCMTLLFFLLVNNGDKCRYPSPRSHSLLFLLTQTDTVTGLFLPGLPMSLFSAQRLRKHPSMINLWTFQKHLLQSLLVWSRTSVLWASFEMRNHNFLTNVLLIFQISQIFQLLFCTRGGLWVCRACCHWRHIFRYLRTKAETFAAPC